MKLTWPHVAVIVAILASIVALSALNRDVGALIGVATLVLAGLGFAIGQQQVIKEQTNGTQAHLLMILSELTNKVAEMQPAPPPITVDAVVGEPIPDPPNHSPPD